MILLHSAAATKLDQAQSVLQYAQGHVYTNNLSAFSENSDRCMLFAHARKAVTYTGKLINNQSLRLLHSNVVYKHFFCSPAVYRLAYGMNTVLG